MADAEISAGVTESAATTPSPEENPNPVISFLLHLLNNLKFNLPPLPFLPPPKHQFIVDSSSSVAAPPLLIEAGSGGSPSEKKESSSDSVSFPRQNFAPLKLEADDVEARDTKPSTIWMVSLYGDFFGIEFKLSDWLMSVYPKCPSYPKRTHLEVTWLRRGHGRGGMKGGQGGIHPMTGLPQTPNSRLVG